MSTASKAKEINTINMLVLRTEQDILNMTGRRVRLIIAPEIVASEELNAIGLMHVICSATGYLPSEVLVKTRASEIVLVRQLICYFVKQYFPDLSLEKIADLIGGYDHTTVIHNIDTCKERIDQEDDKNKFMEQYDAALQAVTQYMAHTEEDE